ncbi:SWIB/MDM2 domain-containing protein [Gorgonomyces haynaldii]|nr:SWIB/MDM2 domain-containing protein [Gorgonomyces haynaldii]
MDAYRQRVKVILKTADLNLVSVKSIRKQIEQEFDADLSDKKHEFEQLVMSLVEAKQEMEDHVEDISQVKEEKHVKEEDMEEDVEEDSRQQILDDERLALELQQMDSQRRTRRGAVQVKREKLVQVSPELQEIVKQEQMPRTDAVARVWDYIRDHGLQDPEDKRKIVANDLLEGILGKKEFTGFQLNSLLSKHLTTNKTKKERKKPSGAFNALHVLSAPLADLVSVTEESRPQVVKRIWDYIKANDLQDPTNKQYILCDDKMNSVFKTKRLSMFKMNAVHMLMIVVESAHEEEG